VRRGGYHHKHVVKMHVHVVMYNVHMYMYRVLENDNTIIKRKISTV